MLFCVPLVLLVAVFLDRRRGFRVPEIDRLTLTVMISLVATMAALGGLVLAIARGAEPQGYARVYGSSSTDPGHFLYNVLATSWPLGYPPQFFSGFGVLSVLVVFIGCLLAVRRGPARPVVAALAFLVLISLVGAATYLPWRRFEPFYSLPYLVGPAGILAIAVRGMINASVSRTALAVLVVVSILIPPAIVADRETAVRAASRLVDYDLAQLISRAEVDSVIFATPSLADQPWQGRGRTLARYAYAMFGGRTIPSTDESCEALSERLTHVPERRVIVLSYHHWCGPIPGTQLTVAKEYRTLTVGRWEVRTDSIAADILVRDPQSGEAILPPAK
jgi:hypothetical protein